MSSEKNLKRLIESIRIFKNNYEPFSKDPYFMRRAKLVQTAVDLMSDYSPKKVPFANRLVLDNFSGSLQHYLTGYDLSSIHLSSKALEVAFLFKIGSPLGDERHRSFGDLCAIAISESRGLIKEKANMNLAETVVNRRNFTMHDAISEQAILWFSREWVQKKISDLPKELSSLYAVALKPYLIILERRLKLFDSLPDLRWYVNNRSLEATKKLIADFLEETIGRTHRPMNLAEGSEGKEILKKIANSARLIQDVKRMMTYELDFIEYSARRNIRDVYTVLNELYGGKLFRF
jgi:hypothetical protein